LPSASSKIRSFLDGDFHLFLRPKPHRGGQEVGIIIIIAAFRAFFLKKDVGQDLAMC